MKYLRPDQFPIKMIPQFIEESIIRQVQQSIAGNEIESPKFDCKRAWYNINDTNGLAEFLKDTTAIVNTFGPDGYILIGYDDKTRQFTDVDITQSGLKDSSDLFPLIIKHISEPFTIAYYEFSYEGHNLGVLHIPPSIQKPHYIRNYIKLDKQGKEKKEEHRVFVRKSTGTFPATKYDVDMMYYDRKNILPDYELHLTMRLKEQNFNISNDRNEMIIVIKPDTTFENTGRRPIVIKSMNFEIMLPTNPSTTVKIAFCSAANLGKSLKGEIVKPNEVFFTDQHIIQASYLTPKSKFSPIELASYLNSIIEMIEVSNCMIEMTNGQLITPILRIL